jgi:hypothetical protein
VVQARELPLGVVLMVPLPPVPWVVCLPLPLLAAPTALLPAAVPLPAHPMAHPEECLLLPLLVAPTALLPAAVPLPAHPMAHPEVCLLLPLLAAPTAHLVVQFPPAPAAASIRQVATTRADSVDNRSSPPILSFLFLGLIIL